MATVVGKGDFKVDTGVKQASTANGQSEEERNRTYRG